MRTVHVTMHTGTPPEQAFEAICDLERFAEHSMVIDRISVSGAGTERQSTWDVTFRQGRLRWRENDLVDAAGHRSRFTLAEGDFDVFEGTWIVEPAAGGSHIRFACSFDFGIASMQGLLEPLAGTTLTTTIRDVVSGLLPGASTIEISP